MAETENENNSPITGQCFSLFFNLIISQLFSGGIGTIIELLRIISTNVLIKYFLKDSFVKKYGIYIQPVIQSILLFSIGILIFAMYEYLRKQKSICTNSELIKFVIILILIFILIGIIIFVFFGLFRIWKKQNIKI